MTSALTQPTYRRFSVTPSDTPPRLDVRRELVGFPLDFDVKRERTTGEKVVEDRWS